MLITLTASVLLLVLPGWLLALAVGIRGWSAAGIAPLLTFALVAVGTVVASASEISWTLANVAGMSAVVIGAACVPAALSRRRHGEVDDRFSAEGGVDDQNARIWSALAIVGLVVGGGIGFITVVWGTGGLTDPNQGFDALFHVNMVETITRFGDVSPDVAGTLNGYEPGAAVYPDAFHAMASLVSQVHGGALPAINALMACVPLVAGMGLVALLRSLGLVREAVVVPIVLASTMGYPTDLIWRGPIWVFAFGISLLPAFLVLLRCTLVRRSGVAAVVLGVSAAGLALVHPSAALAAGLFGVCLLAQRWLSNRAEFLRDARTLSVAGVLAAVLALPLIGQAVVDSGGGTVVDWPTTQSAGEAVGELLLYNYDNAFPQVWLAVPALVGLVLGWRHVQLRWWYWGTAIFVFLCVLAAAYEGRLVQVLTGPWWNDRFRFEGLVFLGLSVFSAVGVVALGAVVERLLRFAVLRSTGRSLAVRGPASVVGTVTAVALLGLLSGGFYVEENKARLDLAYGTDVGGSVTPGDIEAFEVLSELAGDGPVLNDPNDGSAWMWALADVRPVLGAALMIPVNPPLPQERQILVDGLNCLDSHTAVRQAIEELGVRYVYVSHSTILVGPTPHVGFRDLASVDSLRPVYEGEGASIYEVVPVELQDERDESCLLN